MNVTPVSPANSVPGLVNVAVWLEADASLSPEVRAGYGQTLARFAGFCGGRGVAPSVGLARAFVELERLAVGPGAAQLQGWKDALNWFFRRGR